MDGLYPHLSFPPASFNKYLRLSFLVWVTVEVFFSLTSTFPPLFWEVMHLGEYARMLYDFLRNMKLWIRMAASHCSLRGNTSKLPEALSGTFHGSLVEASLAHAAADSKQQRQLEHSEVRVFSSRIAHDPRLFLLLAFPRLVSQKHQITGGIDFSAACLAGTLNTPTGQANSFG